MAELKKIETRLQQLPRKTSPHPLLTRLPPEFQRLFSPHLLIKKNKLEPSNLKRGKTENEA